MLVFALIVAVVVYCVSYWIWAIALTHPQSMMDVMNVVSAMLFVPGNTIFLVFRGLLLVTAFYILADFLLHGLRRGFRRRGKDEPHSLRLKYIFPRNK